MAFSMNAGRKTAMSEINVTPLVDVMLVLLIIFMVTAPMMQEGIPIDPPETKKGEPLAKDPHADDVSVTVTSSGKIFLNNSDSPVQEDKLIEKILEIIPDAKDRATQAVYLRGDKGVLYGEVVRIMGVLGNAGFAKFNLITSSQEESAPKK